METGVNTDASRPMRRRMVRLACLALVGGVVVGCGGGGGGDDSDGGDEESGSTATTAVPTTSTTTAPTTTTTTVPRIVYEIEGVGNVAVNYGLSGGRSQSRDVALPWSEEQAEDPSHISMLVAWGPGAEGDITCRIRRGGEVLAEATLSPSAGPLLACDYPPSGLPQVTFPPPFEG
jgi:hypothetical protein